MLCCLSLALAAGEPTVSHAAQEPAQEGQALSELTKGTPETNTASTAKTATTANTSESGGSTSRTLILAALGAAVVLLSAIGFVIVRDARRVAPAGDADLVDGRPARETAAQLRKRRAKAKAARRQRKRNR